MTLEENMGKDWYQLLSPFIKTDAFQRIATITQEGYSKNKVYPERDNVFKAFRLTPFNDVRVIWLGLQPQSHNNSAVGLSFGVDYKKSHVPIGLQMLLTELESSYDKGLILDFDYSFESWAKQGVLMLNTALTVEKKKAGSHIELWESFTKQVFDLLNLYHPGLVFVLLGDEMQKYKSMIGSNQHIIELSSSSNLLGSKIFNKIDDILIGMNGSDNLIKWNEYR